MRNQHKAIILRKDLKYLLYVALFIVMWTVLVAVCGLASPIGDYLNFENVGAFGNAFGAAGAIAASIAALFAFLAVRDARAEISEQRALDFERELARKRSEIDSMFFRLIEYRMSIIAHIQYQINDIKLTGHNAIGQIFSGITTRVRTSPDPREMYRRDYTHQRNQLGHYFRFSYHILKFLSEQTDSEIKAYELARLFRAQLSNAEIGLIALNCIYGEGEEKLKSLVEKFAILHNINEVERIQLQLDQHFDPSAFDHP